MLILIRPSRLLVGVNGSRMEGQPVGIEMMAVLSILADPDQPKMPRRFIIVPDGASVSDDAVWRDSAIAMLPDGPRGFHLLEFPRYEEKEGQMALAAEEQPA